MDGVAITRNTGVMIRTVSSSTGASLSWIDAVNPTTPELQDLAQKHGLHSKLLEDCLEPEHLPKAEVLEQGLGLFLILRGMDSQATAAADTVQKLTRKLAIFKAGNTLITIHRVPFRFLEELEQKWTGAQNPIAFIPWLTDCINSVIAGYEKPFDDAESAIAQFEHMLFSNRDVVVQLKALHRQKRKVSAYRQVFWHTLSALQKVHPESPSEAPLLQDLRENAEALHQHLDRMIEEINSLVHVQLAMASHRTNETVRLLTVFSVFFLPLTFLAGVYGMNFRSMPELTWKWGYPAVLLFMLGIAGVIYVWFRKKGFLK